MRLILLSLGALRKGFMATRKRSCRLETTAEGGNTMTLHVSDEENGQGREQGGIKVGRFACMESQCLLLMLQMRSVARHVIVVSAIQWRLLHRDTGAKGTR